MTMRDFNATSLAMRRPPRRRGVARLPIANSKRSLRRALKSNDRQADLVAVHDEGQPPWRCPPWRCLWVGAARSSRPTPSRFMPRPLVGGALRLDDLIWRAPLEALVRAMGVVPQKVLLDPRGEAGSKEVSRRPGQLRLQGSDEALDVRRGAEGVPRGAAHRDAVARAALEKRPIF